MPDETAATRLQVARQIAHWKAAVTAIDQPENFASASAWTSLEQYLDVALRKTLQQAVDRLKREITVLEAECEAARSADDLDSVRRHIVTFRRSFFQVEIVLDFYGHAVGTRTNPRLGALLRACDFLAERCMERVLKPLGKPTPPTLVHVGAGLGASVLRAGIPLWDGGVLSPAAAIKITRHNLLRPSALLHEAGHQIAHIVGWNAELADALGHDITPTGLGAYWASTASELAADANAFVNVGYASVAGLHDVLAGDEAAVFRWLPGDPHPVAYLRVLVNVEFCVRFFGATGPWQALADAWRRAHPLVHAEAEVRRLIADSLPQVRRIAQLCLEAPMRAFGGRSISALVDPTLVSPTALRRLEAEAGPALYTSGHWIKTESIRLLALSGFRAATEPERAMDVAKQFESWMFRLGDSVPVAA